MYKRQGSYKTADAEGDAGACVALQFYNVQTADLHLVKQLFTVNRLFQAKLLLKIMKRNSYYINCIPWNKACLLYTS